MTPYTENYGESHTYKYNVFYICIYIYDIPCKKKKMRPVS